MQNRLNRFSSRALNNMNVRALDINVIKIGKYQKKLNKARATAIADNYDSHRMRPIDVSYRGGEFYCFDGQTRIAAYKLMGYTRIPSIIHEGLTYEDEAYLFAKQQDNVGSVLSSHKWNALVEAEDPATMKTLEIAQKNGFKVSGTVSSSKCIAAVKTLQDIVMGSGFEGLDDVLHIIGSAWNDKEVYSKVKNLPIAPTNVSMIEGVYIFMKEYKDCKGFNTDRLIAVLSATKPSAIFSRANDSRKGSTSRRVAASILEIYNHGLRTGSSGNRLPDKFNNL
jgi:hypothetical protein